MQGKSCVAAQDLKPNDKLELIDGEDAFVDAVCYEKLDEPIQVFNFEVEGFHTYYVGADCVLVHNTCNKAQAKKVNPENIEEQYGLKKGTFHREINPAIFKSVPPNSALVGKNPDIVLDRASNIAYQGVIKKGFQDTGLNMQEFIKERCLK